MTAFGCFCSRRLQDRSIVYSRVLCGQPAAPGRVSSDSKTLIPSSYSIHTLNSAHDAMAGKL